MRRGRYLQVRITSEDWRAYASAATRRGMTLSHWVRQQLRSGRADLEVCPVCPRKMSIDQLRAEVERLRAQMQDPRGAVVTVDG